MNPLLIKCILFFLFTIKLTAYHNFKFIDIEVKNKTALNTVFSIKKNAKIFHLFSHGKPGELLLNGKWRNAKGIVTFLQQQKLSSKITHLNIYGCEFAKGKKGLAAVKYIEKATGLQVAASTNITGKNGDWLLEIGNKQIKGLEDYTYNLQIANSGPNDDFDGDGVLNKDDLDDDNDGILDLDECFCNSLEINLLENIIDVSLSVSATSNVTDYTQLQTVLGQPSPLAPEIFINGYDTTGGRGIFSFEYTIPKKIKVGSNGLVTLVFYQYDNIGSSSGGYVTTDRNAKLITDQGDLTDTWNITSAQASILDGGGWVQQTVTFSATPNSILEVEGLELDMEANSGGVVSTTFSSSSSEVYALAIESLQGCSDSIDRDNDGIPDYLDLDSDGDGCPDAIEGDSTTIAFGDLQTSTIDGGNNNDGSTTATYTGLVTEAVQQNLKLPVGTAANNLGVPVSAGNGQGIGASQSGSENTECCSNAGNYPVISDSDGDEIGDGCDLDDDNDGILDTDEGYICQNPPINIDLSQIQSDATANNLDYTFPYRLSYDRTVQLNVTGAFTNQSSADLALGDSGGNLRIGGASGSPNYTTGDTYTFTFSHPVFVEIYAQDPNAAGNFDGGGSGGDEAYLEAAGGFSLTDSNDELDVQSTTSNSIEFRPKTGTNNGTTQASWSIKSLQRVTSLVYKMDGNNAGTLRFAVREMMCNYVDTDNDGIENYLDLDSDGDGCPDAIEGASTTIAFGDLQTNSNIDGGNNNDGSTTAAYTGIVTESVQQNLKLPVGTAATNLGVPVSAGNGQGIGASQSGSENTECCKDAANYLNVVTDTDGDGLGDGCDLDDDNDGILDTDEGTFYTSFLTDNRTCGGDAFPSSINKNFTYNNGNTDIENIGATQTYNFNSPVSNVSFGFVSVHEDNVFYGDFEVTFADGTVVNNVDFTIKNIADYTTEETNWLGTHALINQELELNKVTLGTGEIVVEALGADAAKQAAGFITFNSTAPITSISLRNLTTSSTVTGGTTFEIFGLTNCDIDKDGIPNSLDLDSDGDGCPDAVEGGANVLYTNLNADNSINATVNDNGIPVFVGVGTAGAGTTGQAIGSSQIAGAQSDECDACNSVSTLYVDTDGDNIGNACDLDDDNDGVLDTDENCNIGKPIRYTFNDSTLVPLPVTTGITSADDLIVGPGLTPDLTPGPYLSLGTSVTTDSSINALDYVQSNFKTDAGWKVSLNKIDIKLPNNTESANYNFTVLISDDNFSTSTTLVSGLFNAPVGAGVVAYNFPEFDLTPDTNYLLRVYFYGSKATPTKPVIFDNFRLHATSCKDTDLDGIVDKLDLDSDGDGCPDLVEANVPLTNPEVQAATVTNGNGTDATANETETINNAQLDTGATVTDTNSNGLNDSVEDTAATSPTVNYTSTYVTNALSATVSSCLYDVSLGKKVNNAIIKLGDQITYTLTVKNESNYEVTGIAVTDVLPDGVTHVSDDSLGGFVSGTGIWTIGSMEPNETKILNIVATVNQVGKMINTAEVTNMNETDKDSTSNNGK